MHTATDRAALRRTTLWCEALEERALLATVSATGVGPDVGAGATPLISLTITGTDGDDRIRVFTEGGVLKVLDRTATIGAFPATQVANLVINTGAGNDAVVVDPTVTQPAVINGGEGANKLSAGGGNTTLNAGGTRNALFGGDGTNTFSGTGAVNALFKVKPTDTVLPGGGTFLLAALPRGAAAPAAPVSQLTTDEVNALLQRAAAASASSDAIIVVTDRNGRILGVRVESGVDPNITSSADNLVFAIDGAYSKALTAAYFANDQGPLTSRTVGFISQSTITEREVNSNPNVTDPNSTVRGPGFVAAVGSKGHFPPGIANTPQVDLFGIEHTNRDGTFAVGADGIKGTADDIQRELRFNADRSFVLPGQELFVPDSYGFQSGLKPGAQSRGIATLPGGVPIYKDGHVVGGIGVFFPGKTGYATEENSSLSSTFDSRKPDRTLEAEWIAFAAVGGTTASVDGTATLPVGALGGVTLSSRFGLPTGRLDLVGIQLDVFGPGGAFQGAQQLQLTAAVVGRGDPNDGRNQQVSPDGATLRGGQAVPDGWLVLPHDGDGIRADEVVAIVANGLQQASQTRGAIRLPISSPAKFVYAVSDRQGNVVGLYRQPDATVFSIDVAVAKARNVSYYSNPLQLQPIDQVQGLPPGVAMTARTFRYLAEPRFPEAIDTAPPGPFSQLNDDPVNTNRFNGRLVGQALPASAYQSVLGHDAFNPGTNFHSPFNLLNQNGIIFFPGSSPLYTAGLLKGGFGVSGDGVDQDDVVTVAGENGFNAPVGARADQYLVNGVRLPYQKFNRNPEGGLFTD
ncbi:heme-binding protein [Gemmata sp. JC673]|uniref:Heme-binding protein n=1 Tax=Gemmata algarum TaxID=2975278 RepID=A0ABU5EVY6_9BACT|nr:heme-binding protein [Gemmata algarum]MDY3559133.1 heme-binding protein [Gemmata algarum]